LDPGRAHHRDHACGNRERTGLLLPICSFPGCVEYIRSDVLQHQWGGILAAESTRHRLVALLITAGTALCCKGRPYSRPPSIVWGVLDLLPAGISALCGELLGDVLATCVRRVPESLPSEAPRLRPLPVLLFAVWAVAFALQGCYATTNQRTGCACIRRCRRVQAFPPSPSPRRQHRRRSGGWRGDGL